MHTSQPVVRPNGFTIKVIAQHLNIEYTGVPTTSRGSGRLASVLSSLNAGGEEGKSAPSTVSAVLYESEDSSKEGVERVSRALESHMVTFKSYHREACDKVNTFHARLREEKAKLLTRSKVMVATITSDQLEQLRSNMEPFNPGPITKVMVQVNIRSSNPRPGLKRNKEGSYSVTRTLYSCYVKAEDSTDLKALVDSIVAKFDLNDSTTVTQKHSAIVQAVPSRARGLEVHIRSVPADTAVVSTPDGRTTDIPMPKAPESVGDNISQLLAWAKSGREPTL